VRIDRVLPSREARDEEDERHVHPLQIDVIERALVLYSNPGDIVLTPFMGVGSEVYAAVRLGRIGLGIELKPTYFRQTARNLEMVERIPTTAQTTLFEWAAQQTAAEYDGLVNPSLDIDAQVAEIEEIVNER